MPTRLASIALGLCLPATALADALDCYRAGNAAMKAGDFAAAAEDYATARAEAGCAEALDGLLFNEAVALERLAGEPESAEDEATACRALTAMREASKVARDATRDAIADAITRLAPRCPPPGSLTIECIPPGGTVLLPVLSGPRACPARYPEVRPGRYAGEVVAAGRNVPFEAQVISGEPTAYRVELHTLAPPPPPVADAPVDLSPYGWSAVGLGLISGGVAAWAWSEGADIADAAGELDPDDTVGYDALADDHQVWGRVYTGGLIGAGLLLATGATLLILDDHDAPVEAVIGPVSGFVVRWGP